MKPVALITGGASGIGLGISEALAGVGFRLVVSGRRDVADVAEALAALQERTEVMYCCSDVAVAEQREELLREVREHFGALHCLVNNAGVAPERRCDLLDATEASYERVMRINLQGPYFLTQSAANWMLDQQVKDPESFYSIINIGSISATVASPSRGEYCLSKAAMRMMTSLYAVRLAEHGIQVYEVQPGLTLSGMTDAVMEQYTRKIEAGICLQPRWGTPEDNGKAVAALATGQFPYSPGAVIPTDGGLMIQKL